MLKEMYFINRRMEFQDVYRLNKLRCKSADQRWKWMKQLDKLRVSKFLSTNRRRVFEWSRNDQPTCIPFIFLLYQHVFVESFKSKWKMTGTKVLAFQSFLIEKPANSRQYFSWQKGRNKAHHPFFYCQVGWKRNAWSFCSCDGNEANESWAGLIDISLCNITFSLLRVTVDRCFSFYTTATFRLSYSIQKKKKIVSNYSEQTLTWTTTHFRLSPSSVFWLIRPVRFQWLLFRPF